MKLVLKEKKEDKVALSLLGASTGVHLLAKKDGKEQGILFISNSGEITLLKSKLWKKWGFETEEYDFVKVLLDD